MLRAAGAAPGDTLQQVEGCTYSSPATGAVFAFGSGALGQPGGSGLTPLLAFQSTFTTTSTSNSAYSSVAGIFNLAAVQYTGSAPSTYGGSIRLRNAGTLQQCQDSAGGFIVYDASCVNTAKGYILFNTGHGGFDYFTTDPTGGAVTTGGTLTSSMVIGLVGKNPVPLQLLHASATSYGMALFLPETSLASGSVDGSYAVTDLAGAGAGATVSGAAFTDAGASATLSYDTPIIGVVQASGAINADLVFGNGLAALISPPGSAGAVFQLGQQL